MTLATGLHSLMSCSSNRVSLHLEIFAISELQESCVLQLFAPSLRKCQELMCQPLLWGLMPRWWHCTGASNGLFTLASCCTLALQIHWFSIFNSFMMVIFLTGLVSMILMRTLRADYARYTAKEDDDLEALERDVGEESG